MEVNGFGSTDVGRQRETNEDAFLIDDRLGVYAVADGMGGHAAGEEAARLAIGAVEESIREARETLGSGEPDNSVLRRAAIQAVETARTRVHDQATTVPELSGMGCTLTLLLTSGTKAVMAHVGDSRLYLCREGSTWQLSSDHTLAADMVRRGEISAEEAREHPYSNALTRALGSHGSVEPETLILDILPDDVFLLCSDGLSHYVDSPGELSTALGGDDPSRAARELVDRANERGGRDNITAVVVRVSARDQEQEASLAEDVRTGLQALRTVPSFEAARFADRLRLFNLAEIRSYAGGDVVVPGEQRMGALYIPLVGELEVVRPDGSSRRIRRGHTLGLTSLLVPRRWRSRVTARSDVRLLAIESEAFQQLTQRRPWMGVRVLSALAKELESELPRLVEHGEGSNGGSRRWWSPTRWIRSRAH